MNKDEINKTIELYSSGIGTNEIAEILGFHRSSIQYNLKKQGIKLRHRSPGNKYNVFYFDNYTEENCYWAGFIYADGNVRKDGCSVNIHLSSVDLEALEFIAKATKYNGNIEKCKDGSVRIYFTGKWFPNALKENYGIGPNKSKDGRIPKNLDKKSFKHFIRGLFDGDGCITISTVPTINFTLNKEDCYYLSKYFYNNLDVKLKQKHKYAKIMDKGSYGQIHYSGKNAKKILDWMYSESTEETRLRRKYELYKKLWLQRLGEK